MTEEELAGVILGGLQWQDPDASFGTTSQGQKRMADHIARAILSSPLFARMMANAASLENEVGLLQAELQVAAEQARLAAYAECAEIADANADAYEATLSQGLSDPGLFMKAAEARTLAAKFRQASGAAAHVSRSEFDRTDEALTITTVALRNILAEWGRDPVTNLVDWQRCVDRIHDRARKAIDEADAAIRAAANPEKQG